MKSYVLRRLHLGHLGFTVAAIVILTMSWTLYGATVQARAAAKWVLHTQAVLLELDSIDEQIALATAAHRGYLLDPTQGFAQDRDRSLQEAEAATRRAAALTGDNSPQVRRAQGVLTALEQSRQLMRGNESRQARENGHLSGAMYPSSLILGSGRLVRTQVADMRNEELRLLSLRQAEEQAGERRITTVLIGGLLISLTVLVPAYLGFVRQLRKRELVERRLQDLADSLPLKVWRLWSSRGRPARFEFIGKGPEEVHGATREAALLDPKSLLRSIIRSERAKVFAAIRNVRPESPGLDVEYQVRSRSGTVRWVRSCATVATQPDSSVIWNGYSVDITDHKRLAKELQLAKEAADAANKAKSTFLATMSHEIRTPMNGVLGMLELLELTRLDAEQRGTLSVVRESGRSLLRIIDDILDFSKIEAGRLALIAEPVSIVQVVERCYQIFSGVASSKGLLLSRDVDANISPALVADSHRLAQILNNFISNALKFTHTGTVRISAQLIERSAGTDRVRFAVEDSGIGISPDIQEQLFEPFTQAEHDTSKRYGGTGLGLAICRRLAVLMDGVVGIRSKPGQGTTMTLELSLAIADPSLLRDGGTHTSVQQLGTALCSRRVAPSTEEARSDGTLVLVVDDHPTNRAVLMHQMSALGYAAHSAADGREALDKWQAESYALIVTDCNMPHMSGHDLAREIRMREAQEHRRRTPIIACTANALAGEAELCLAAGMDDYLAKPVELATLMRRLDQWLPTQRRVSSTTGSIASSGASAELDRSVLAELSGGDAGVERDILLDFRRVNDADALILRRAVSDGDMSLVTRISHRIKGACRMIGAKSLAKACADIEDASRAGDFIGTREQMSAFQVHLSNLNDQLEML